MENSLRCRPLSADDDQISNLARCAMRIGFDIEPWLTSEASDELARLTRPHHLAVGQAVYMQDDAGDAMYQVRKGYVRLSVRHTDGRQTVFLLFGPGDWFGVSSLVDDGPRPHSAEAISDVEIGVLTRAQYLTMRARHPSFSDALMRLLALQMRVASRYFVVTHVKSLKGQVARRLLELAAMRSETANSGTPHVIVTTQSELAEMVGVSRQSASKALQRLQAERLISLGSGRIVVDDLLGLAHASEL